MSGILVVGTDSLYFFKWLIILFNINTLPAATRVIMRSIHIYCSKLRQDKQANFFKSICSRVNIGQQVARWIQIDQWTGDSSAPITRRAGGDIQKAGKHSIL